MNITIDNKDRQAVQILSGLGMMLTSNPLAMGIGAVVACEAVMEDPAKKLIENAKEPLMRFVKNLKTKLP